MRLRAWGWSWIQRRRSYGFRVLRRALLRPSFPKVAAGARNQGSTIENRGQGSARIANLNGVGRCRKKAREMKVAALFRLTATVISIQIALRVLVTCDLVSPLVHLGCGVVLV